MNSEIEVIYVVAFAVPITVKYKEAITPQLEREGKNAAAKTASEKIAQGKYKPVSINRIWEGTYNDIVSENKTGEHKIPRDTNGRGEIIDVVGHPEWEVTAHDEEMHRNEQGTIERNDSGTTGKTGDEVKD